MREDILDSDLRFAPWKFHGLVPDSQRPSIQQKFAKAGLELPEGPLVVIRLHNECDSYMNAQDVRSAHKIAHAQTEREYAAAVEAGYTKMDLTKAHQLAALEQAAEALNIDDLDVAEQPARIAAKAQHALAL